MKIFEIDGIGPVQITKRRGAKSLRISVAANGVVRLTMPYWTPYIAGVEFARAKSPWIQAHVPIAPVGLSDGQRIGKTHKIEFVSAPIDTPASRVIGTIVRVSRPTGMAVLHPEVQKVAQRAGVRALRRQSESLLPQRLHHIAGKFGFSYASVSVKQLKGRWGSCDSARNIVLNLYLMQLPWPLIDYVLLHELVHTKHLNHGADFWDEFLKHEPQAKQLRSQIRQHKPLLQATPAAQSMS